MMLVTSNVRGVKTFSKKNIFLLDMQRSIRISLDSHEDILKSVTRQFLSFGFEILSAKVCVKSS